MLISPAFAQAAGGFGDMGQWTGLMPIVLMFVLLYFMLIRPQMKRAKDHKAMTEALQKGDEVVTSGGVLGKIAKVGEAYLALEVASGVEVMVQKGAVQTLLPKGTIKSL
ncbi:MAG: preprotein translocase subunit YajC [Betaproteobacteria bacterium RBG_16_64_9]|nr:MAG: preprotein translocase subunit YajC [Betaproteobacteria bacterium RBG_16_64_9]